MPLVHLERVKKAARTKSGAQGKAIHVNVGQSRI
jgi:hypothetical protein